VGDGLIVAEGIHHKQQRKHISPSFTFRQIKRQYPLFWEKALKMTKVIESETFRSINGIANPDTKQADVTDVDYWAPKATLDIIGVAGLGRDFNTLENSGDKLARLYEQLTTPSGDMHRLAMLHIFLGHKAASLLCPTATRCFNDLNKELRALSEQLVAEKKEQVKAKPNGSVDTLTGLIQAELFSDKELVDQLLTLLIAG
jgi:cytochrome P450